MDSKSQAVVFPLEQLFPTRLYDLLEFLEKEGIVDICSFLPHGRAFLVVDPKRFEDEILPKWFRQSQWTSFQRQLNLYDFKRITSGRDKGAYYNPNFLRGQRELCRFIIRNKVKGLGPRKPGFPETEPDFYQNPLPLPAAIVPLREAHHTSIPTLIGRSVSPTLAVASDGSMAFPMRLNSNVVPRTTSATSSAKSFASWAAASQSTMPRSFRPLLSGSTASLPISTSNSNDTSSFGPGSSRGTSPLLAELLGAIETQAKMRLLQNLVTTDSLVPDAYTVRAPPVTVTKAELLGAIETQAKMRLLQNLVIADSLVPDANTGRAPVTVTETQTARLPMGGGALLNNFVGVGSTARNVSGSIRHLYGASVSTGNIAASSSPRYNPFIF